MSDSPCPGRVEESERGGVGGSAESSEGLSSQSGCRGKGGGCQRVHRVQPAAGASGEREQRPLSH